MFGLFENKNPEVSISDQVWLSKQSKWDACVKMAFADSHCVFVAWFPHTKEELSVFFDQHKMKPILMLASDIKLSRPDGFLIFVEHYPLSEVEQELFKKLNLSNVPVLSSLDEPLFAMFGGEKSIQLMKTMGMKEGEIVSHPMITQSIRSAQKKIAKKVRVELMAESQKAWLDKNLKMV